MTGKYARTCCVIMPFGQKTDSEGNQIDFDTIYNYIVRPPIEKIGGIECIRADQIERAGLIHKDMFEHIHSGDVAIVDVTTLNANVFSQLRSPSLTAPGGDGHDPEKGNEAALQHSGSACHRIRSRASSRRRSQTEVEEFVKNELKAGGQDSPVLDALPEVQVTKHPRRLEKLEVHLYGLKNDPRKRIAIVTGDIRNAKGVGDVWVNNENTNMQMARFYGSTISAVIRYLGSRRNQSSRIEEDTIANELRDALGRHDRVDPEPSWSTSAGSLSKTHGVKRIFHAASHQGQIASGYQPIADVSACVTAALERADSEEYRQEDLRSILFPLMGTNQGRNNLDRNARLMLRAAVTYLVNNPETTIEKVCFLAYTDRDLEDLPAGVLDEELVDELVEHQLDGRETRTSSPKPRTPSADLST